MPAPFVASAKTLFQIFRFVSDVVVTPPDR
jgi:hypothetical protein